MQSPNIERIMRTNFFVWQSFGYWLFGRLTKKGYVILFRINKRIESKAPKLMRESDRRVIAIRPSDKREWQIS